jgi:hypothetical protein
VFSILPSFVVRYKRWHTDAIEKLMVLLFIVEDSYRMAGVSQAFGIDVAQSGSWAALERTTGEAISPMALWRLVQWFGQLSPAQLNLALGVEPPSHVIEDEKHMRQSGEKAYVPMIYAPKEALIWWIDYIDSVSEAALTASLERFKAISERLGHITGATVDGWDPAQNALRKVFPGLTLAECHLHAMLKFAEHLATYKRQRKTAGLPVSDAEETQIRDAFLRVLQAATEQEYQKALDELPQAFDSDPLASRKQSLTAKQTLFQAWITDGKLATPTQNQLPRRPYLIQPPHRRAVGGFLEQFRLLPRLLRDLDQRVGEGVQRVLALGLGRLDHQRFLDDQREVDGRRMEVVVHQPLGDVHGVHVGRAVEDALGHELVHARPLAVGHRVRALGLQRALR